MASIAPHPDATGPLAGHRIHPAASIAFLLVLLGGIGFAAANIALDTRDAGEPLAVGAFAFLGLALLVALAFEFVNGFHDTANAVATVIYTRSLAPVTAVIWSGAWNFAGVVASSGAVAYSIVTLLPVDLVLGVGSASGYAMIFALLIAALIWNLGTWWLGLPNSSSHALGMAAAQDRPRTVPSVGAMKDIAGAQEKPDPRATYKIVFDVQTLGDSSDEASPALESIDGFIKTYTGYGIPLSHLQMTAVFHGRTIQLMTRDDVYRQRTGTSANPNAKILGELAAAGVHMVVCGQSTLAQHFSPADYLPGVTTNLSATVTFLNLQIQGYVKISE